MAVLVGAGHAHLHVVRQSAQLRDAGVDPVLIAPRWFHYSGLATGVLSGALQPEAAKIDVEVLARECGVAYRPGRVVGIDRSDRRLVLDTGERLTFDAVSFNIGSEVAGSGNAQPAVMLWPVKPLTELFELRRALEAAARTTDAAPTVVVAGGGQSGFEVAAAVTGLMERLRLRPRVFLVVAGAPAWGPSRARDRLLQVLTGRGVTIVGGAVIDHDPGHCCLADGQRLPCDHLVWAAGLRPPALIGALGLPVADDGRLRLHPTLASIADDAIFGAGDCAVVDVAPRPGAGVFGVRAAPILLHNLAALGDGRPLRVFRPQRSWLSIMDLGDGRGLAMRGRFWWLGRSALQLKRYLDLGFIRRMRARLPQPKDAAHDRL
ncbi:NAD(P)/FAD-dependent oxidoreductase [Brevundimonas sp.]|uniref:NAD(P)/FAD-dependent oxidoreductase n=1 Tax=Brevundimonas sp. TaxID=1871086 RepID=UPI003F6FCEE5